MKWSQITKGKRARKRAVEFTPLDADEPVKVDLRILDGADRGSILEFAAAYARSRGGEVREGDPLYDFGVDVKTVALGVVDPESPDDRPEPFFASADEVFEALDRDRICTLAHQQKAFQAQVSPFPMDMTPNEYGEAIAEIAYAEEGGPDSPFARWQKWPPDFQWRFQRFTAQRLVTSLSLNSTTSSSDTSAS